jgi:tetratricopeptide (TPR) repeat protein
MTDVAEFRMLLRQAAQELDSSARIRLLSDAVGTYEGELLPGHYDEWVLEERSRLHEEHIEARLKLAAAQEAAGDASAGIAHVRAAIRSDPMCEEAHRLMLRLYEATGRTNEAIRHYRELERVLDRELGTLPSATTQELFQRLLVSTAARGAALPPPAPEVTLKVSETQAAEPTGGAVPLTSPFYVTRPADVEFQAALVRQDSIVLVKGPRQVGKTSLLARALQACRLAGARVVLTDFQKLTAEQLGASELLFLTLAEMLVDQLELDASAASFWQPHRGWNVNFERFIRRVVLPASPAPLVWGLDEVDRLFGQPHASEVFGLFRSWHNERSLDPSGPWRMLTLAIAYATEAHLFITDLNQSPFNVGTRLVLEDFDRDQVEELNRRHGSPLCGPADMRRFIALVGGHPYLVRCALYQMHQRSASLEELEAKAASHEGAFGDHLRRLRHSLSQDPGLVSAVRCLLEGSAIPDEDSFVRLRSAGVLVGTEQAPSFRCGLYRAYFARRLSR